MATVNKIDLNGDTYDIESSALVTTQPTTPSEGAVYYDTVNDVVKVYDGTNWNPISGGGGGSGDVVGPNSSTNGHVAVFDGATGKVIKDGGVVPTGVPSGGTNGQVLTIVSGNPAWANATGGADIEYKTQAEYNALLPGAESDGKHYFIYSSDVLFSYSYDFRGKTPSDLTTEGWTTTSGTSSVSSNGLLVVGYSGIVVKSGFDFSNANKITLTTLLYADGHAIWHSLTDSSSNYLSCNMDVRQNFRRLDFNGSYNDGTGSSSGEKTFTTVIDLVNKNIVWSVTGYQDVTKSLSDADVTLIRQFSKIELGCWSAYNNSQNIFKTVSLTIV